MRLLGFSYEVVLTDKILEELFDITKRKIPEGLSRLKIFMGDFEYIIVETPSNLSDYPHMRDEKDKPILAAAIYNNIDYLITGDKDFLVLSDIITKPKILTMNKFIDLHKK